MSRFAGRPVGLVAGVTAAILVLVSGRYRYHRDELYFLEAGQHLAWGYPDQPPLVPFVARVVSSAAPVSLVAHGDLRPARLGGHHLPARAAPAR